MISTSEPIKFGHLFAAPLVAAVMVFLKKMLSSDLALNESDLVKFLFISSIFWRAPRDYSAAYLKAVRHNWAPWDALDYILRLGFAYGLAIGVLFMEDVNMVKLYAFGVPLTLVLIYFTAWGRTKLQKPSAFAVDASFYDVNRARFWPKIEPILYTIYPLIGVIFLAFGPFGANPMAVRYWFFIIILTAFLSPYYHTKPRKELGDRVYFLEFAQIILGATASLAPIWLTLF